MKIFIVGSGLVGRTTGKVLTEFGYNVSFFDLNRNILKDLKNHGYKVSHSINDVKDYDLSFICTPTPTKDRRLEDQSVREAISKIDSLVTNHTIVIRSTILPEYPLFYKQHIIKNSKLLYNPEFFRSEYPENDFKGLPFALIGFFHLEDTKILMEIYQKLKKEFILRMHMTDACLFKYLWNCLLATKISFYNEVKQIFEWYGRDIRKIMPYVGTDKLKTEQWYLRDFLKEGFQDECLPKDLIAFISAMKKKNLKVKLLKAVEEINNEQI